jgi:hypothetical protein
MKKKKKVARYGVLWVATVTPEDGGRMSLRNADAYEN